ncbi:MAG: HigA family addiction module antidote protein [Chloroflexi bacterium]|nr:HigA family addiction module antidote protein [Chloroflexota bacterium]
MPIHDPCHPGEIVRYECLEPLGLTITRAARGLGISRQKLSDVINGRASISAEMAIRLSMAFGSTPETWLGIQAAYDLWQAQDLAESIEVEKFAVATQAQTSAR